jgi:hypothetical protein
MLSKTHVIHERSNIIHIKNNLSTTMKDSPKGEYSLKQTFFDPSKSSPPNDFLIKLHKRMSIYSRNFYIDIKDDNRDNE